MNTKPPAADFPFAGSLLESLELMKKVWGAGFSQMPGFASPPSMLQSLPTMMVPTLDTDELDKRIADLRAVEQWLALNANVLHASIQALEVQRNTIATLKTLSTTMMTAPLMAKPAPAQPPAPIGSAFPPAAAPSPTPRRNRRPAARETRAPTLAEMPMNPAAWWGTLQDQFTRIAAAAASGTASATPAATEPKAAEAEKPAARRPPPKRTT
jgi:hypothetical protein